MYNRFCFGLLVFLFLSLASVPAIAVLGTPSVYNLGTLGGTYSDGYGINTSGQVAGWSFKSGNGASHAFRYDGAPGAGGVMRDLGTLGGTNSYGKAVNASGQ